MKNQKFFFSAIAVLLVLAVFVLFFFGFKSRVFAQVGTVGLVSEHVAAVDRGVVSNAVVRDVINSVTDKTSVVALNAVSSVITHVRVVEGKAVQPNVDSVGELVKTVSNTTGISRTDIVV